MTDNPNQTGNIIVTTMPPGDNTNAAASTAFVTAAVGTTVIPAALSSVNDTNVTIAATGTPATSLLQAVTLTMGWTGTLAAGRLNSNVVQAVTNDTNIQGSITAQNLTFAWAGTLANARLANMNAWTIKGNVTGSAAAPTDFTIDGLTVKSTPVSADELILWDVAGAAIKKATVGSLPSGSSSGTLVSIVTYSSSQTITIPTGATKAAIALWGGQGGDKTSNNGGAGAGWLFKYLTGLTPANTVVLTVGGKGTSSATPTAGGNSTLVSGTQTISTLTANGGGAGTAIGGAGPAGGTATGGDENDTGQAGSNTTLTSGACATFAPFTGMSAGGKTGGGGCTIWWFI